MFVPVGSLPCSNNCMIKGLGKRHICRRDIHLIFLCMANMTVVSLPIFLNILFFAFAYAGNLTISPNCPSTCAGVDIPYPFGVGKDCYRDKGFEVICNYTDNIVTLGVNRLEVTEISLGQVEVSSFSVKTCPNETSRQRIQVFPVTHIYNLTQTPFSLSGTQNRFFTIGCDIYAQISNMEGTFTTAGCESVCLNGFTDIENGSCEGVGCCQSAIPMSLKSFNITVDSSNNDPSPSVSSNVAGGCWSAAVRKLFLGKTAVLDWAIRDEETCKEAKKNLTTFACRDKKSYCVDSIDGHGYRCSCFHGYTGNPYLLNGCQDIDECKGPNNCTKEADCINGPGYYNCRCLSGWKGDGKINGIGCKLYQRSSRITVVLIGIGVGVGLLIFLALGFLSYNQLKKRKLMKLKQRFFKRNGGLLLKQEVSSGKGNIKKTRIFEAEELERATDNFNESRILGRGGSGTVYKGMLSDGKIVAIKKSKLVDESQIGQFINELVILSQINHRHIVQLFGCCLETEVPLLAYEFVSNGTLSYHLHHDDRKSSISWGNRLRIATEVAGAISYMHSSATTPIFHRDIKSSNILLDENLKAKVSDFGISRSLPHENTHLTTIVQGTFGYLDPEYFHSSQFTDKSDVYSFGVVLVELLTGQKPISSTRPEQEKNLAMHFISLIKENRVFEILETRVLNEGKKEELLVFAKLAKRCLKLVGKKRPTMKEVTAELEGLRRVEEQQCVPQYHQDTQYDSSSVFSMTGPQHEDSTTLSQGRA